MAAGRKGLVAAFRAAISRAFRLSPFALAIGLHFFAASLTPSLIPRIPPVQGILGGLLIAIGYMLGRLIESLWRYMEVAPPNTRTAHILARLFLLTAIASAMISLWHVTEWQNSVRRVVGMEEWDRFSSAGIILLAAPVFALLIVIGAVIQVLFDRLRGILHRFVPVKVANVSGLLLALYLGWAFVDGFIIQRLFETADRIYAAGAQVFEPDQEPPSSALLSGGPGSLVEWGEMGNRGRLFVANAPDAETISSHSGKPALDPIRIYVGLNSADTVEERTAIALAEMERTGAFDRKILVVAVPVGTGWLDDGSHVPLEFIHDGDVATVGVQYSYLTSTLSLLFSYQAGIEQSESTFNAIYNRWRAIPPPRRPELYVHGISQGAFLGMNAINSFRLLGDPIDGAFFAGPPFLSGIWSTITTGRDDGTPYVLPVQDRGETVRFYNQDGIAPGTDARWGKARIAFLQYASDPIVFFSPASAFRPPAWMREEPGPDVSPAVRWVPVVTTFQLAVDMMLSLAIAPGHGHYYIAEDYIPIWVELTEPEGWTEADTARLVERFRDYQAW